jgi:acyl-[acyl-carrier-protein] desaturase
VADKIMTRVALDENLHMVFYRDTLAAMLEIAPSDVIKAITREVLAFEMPGSGMAGFARKAARIADAGIYDLRIHHDETCGRYSVIGGVFDRIGLDAEAEHDRERLRQFLDNLEASARKYEERRAARRDRRSNAGA